MKVIFEKIPESNIISFTNRRFKRKTLPVNYHFHREYEITFAIEGSGTRYIGNSIKEYRKGDLVLLGSYLPHCWVTDKPSENVVIQFEKDFLGKEFFDKPELLHIKKILSDSRRGLVFGEKVYEESIKYANKIFNKSGFEKTIQLLKLLNFLANTNNFQYASTEGYHAKLNQKDLGKVQQIYNYIISNYKADIKLDKAAQIANLTKSSFCKYLKKRTKKTFSQLVNEVRIGHATQLLIETEKTIAQVCYESGYNDISNFNKRFKEIILISPLKFRKKYR